MSIGEILSLIAVCLSFIGVAVSFGFSYRKVDKERDSERELNVKQMTVMNDKLDSIGGTITEVRTDVKRIDEKMQNDHEVIIRHDQKINNLEAVVFKTRKKGDK